jgi:hypothetical protein
MKNLPLLIFITLVTFLVAGCTHSAKVSDKPNPHRIEIDNTSQQYNRNYRVYTLEGCEYIVVGSGNHQWGSHKGTCKNPIHKKYRDTR